MRIRRATPQDGEDGDAEPRLVEGDSEEQVDGVIAFEPSYHLEWLLGPDIEVVFEADEDVA